MKHRKDWTEWKSKRQAELKQRRETNRIILDMLQKQIDSMHAPGGLIARLMSNPKPMRGGEVMRVPIIYKDLR